MQMLMGLLMVVQIVSAVAMIGLVLIQHGKGADMGASFGGGASGSLFGATGSANFLSRSTAACATVFFAATLGLAFSAGGVRQPAGDVGSVLDRAAAASAVVPVVPQIPVSEGAAASNVVNTAK
ncbi:preprotein translocase subunit SecG [Ideonella livida]|uniref:Protein-export membrane protein SecG n=1 Tax=Ideonella livida TaxID=2707176 RepID=A0A7C9TIN4_9BURK|nr:preprotein translocase subunit SecG [Ideonella livida]NDY91421.1 preprotein translocase subunit SecG [Ideonella livida]